VIDRLYFTNSRSNEAPRKEQLNPAVTRRHGYVNSSLRPDVLQSSSRKTTQGPDNAEADRPFSSSLRKRIELRSKEKICFAGLKKKVARLYKQSLRHLDRESDPPKRKRGRPRKDSSKPQINLPALPEAGPRQVRRSPNAKLINMQGEAAVMSDEQLALQLHWDLNIPMLRRSRSRGLSNVSNSEQ